MRTLRMLYLVALSVVVFPVAALAQEAVDAPVALPSMLVSALTVALPLLLAVVQFFWKDRTATRMRVIAVGIDVAYHATTNLAKFTDTKVDDKVALALGQLKTFLDANGYALTPQIEAQAKLQWSAMHALEKQGLVAASAAAPAHP